MATLVKGGLRVFLLQYMSSTLYWFAYIQSVIVKVKLSNAARQMLTRWHLRMISLMTVVHGIQATVLLTHFDILFFLLISAMKKPIPAKKPKIHVYQNTRIP